MLFSRKSYNVLQMSYRKRAIPDQVVSLLAAHQKGPITSRMVFLKTENTEVL